MEEENNELIETKEKSKNELILEYKKEIDNLIQEKNEFEYNARTQMLIYIKKIEYLQQQIEELINQ